MLALVLVADPSLAEKKFYRYENAQGRLVQSDRLPPEAVPGGYSVVSASGDIIEIVPRQLTADELVERNAEREERLAREQERDRIRKWDQSLILRYSNVEEIDQARARGLREFDTRIGILRGNLMSLKGQIEAEQGDAADYLRRGREVSKALQARIDSLRGEVQYADNTIRDLELEKIALAEKYDKDRQRFQYLMNQAALRL